MTNPPNDEYVARLHKRYNGPEDTATSQVTQLTNTLLTENDAKIEKLAKRLKSFKKKLGNLPELPKVKLIEVRDPFRTTTWSSHMEDLAWTNGDIDELRKFKRR